MSNKVLVPAVKFIPEWSRRQFDEMQDAIIKHFRSKRLLVFNNEATIIPKNWEGIYNLLGLSYTSSSSYAGYWACNGDAKYDEKYNYIGFAISKGGKFCAICWDAAENELIIEL